MILTYHYNIHHNICIDTIKNRHSIHLLFNKKNKVATRRLFRYFSIMSSNKINKFKYIVLGGGNASGYAANQFDKNGLTAGELCIITDEPVEIYENITTIKIIN